MSPAFRQIFLLVFCSFWLQARPIVGRGGTFSIDRHNHTFLLDGVPFRYISASLHYFRVHPDLWPDRLRKIRASGVNALQFYVAWNRHEPEPGRHDFAGRQDVERFLRLARKHDLLVLLRPGPYIDAERDMGGLPYWLLRENRDMKLRTKDPSYLEYVRKWYEVLLPKIEPYLYANGGPIIMVQVENEYGSYGLQTKNCDVEYLSFLRDLLRKHLGNETLLYSTDGDGIDYVRCGKVAGVYSTVDFGSGGDFAASFKVQRLFEPNGPLVNSEFYPGWIDHWGYPHSKVKSADVTQTLDGMLAMGANVNIYPMHGGTQFGFEAGANSPEYDPNPTSYDFDAPISEAGDLTEKYYAIQDVLRKYVPIPEIDLESTVPKAAYGEIRLKPFSTVLHSLPFLTSGKPVLSSNPLTFEELSHPYGFVVYETIIQNRTTDPAQLEVDGIRDRGHVYVDGEFRGVLSRMEAITTLPLIGLGPGVRLQIVVENQGRICYGPDLNDFKGIVGNVTLGQKKHVLDSWKMWPLAMEGDRLAMLSSQFVDIDPSIESGQVFERMSLWKGQLDVPCPGPAKDTFLKMPGWSKGVIWVDGVNLGRYWPSMGPQMTLYLPAPVLGNRCGPHNVVMLEQDRANCTWSKTRGASGCSIWSVDQPELDGPTPELW